MKIQGNMERKRYRTKVREGDKGGKKGTNK